MTEKEKTCVHLGCNQQYYESEVETCVYHSGKPFFHEGYKGWSCCQQKSTDFTTFLSFKGCVKGFHSDIKEEKEIKEKEIQEKEEKKQVFKEEEINERQIDDKIWISIKVKEIGNFSQISPQNTRIQCTRCQTSDESKECVFHSGKVIFHETLKYYTCCQQKKFTDFDQFKAFKGCAREDKHQMREEKGEAREDWFQTQQDVHLVLYALKGVRSAHSSVMCRSRDLKVSFCDQKGETLFAREWRLNRPIVGQESRVVVSPMKVELILRKNSRENWSSLE